MVNRPYKGRFFYAVILARTRGNPEKLYPSVLTRSRKTALRAKALVLPSSLRSHVAPKRNDRFAEGNYYTPLLIGEGLGVRC